MTPKITDDMREALHRSHGRPVDVEDEQEKAVYVLVRKDTFAQLRETQGTADEATRRHLRALIEEGVASGDYEPADAVFADLRRYAGELASKQRA
jgi:PHD/YefM family antitoxin component YafN of YafNO toxin-antitoxin module